MRGGCAPCLSHRLAKLALGGAGALATRLARLVPWPGSPARRASRRTQGGTEAGPRLLALARAPAPGGLCRRPLRCGRTRLLGILAWGLKQRATSTRGWASNDPINHTGCGRTAQPSRGGRTLGTRGALWPDRVWRHNRWAEARISAGRSAASVHLGALPWPVGRHGTGSPPSRATRCNAWRHRTPLRRHSRICERGTSQMNAPSHLGLGGLVAPGRALGREGRTCRATSRLFTSAAPNEPVDADVPTAA